MAKFGNFKEHEDLCLIHVQNQTILKDKIYPRFYLESCSNFQIKQLYDTLFYSKGCFDRKLAIEMLAEITVKKYYEIIFGLFLEELLDNVAHDFVLFDVNGRNLYIRTIGVTTNEDFYYQMFS